MAGRGNSWIAAALAWALLLGLGVGLRLLGVGHPPLDAHHVRQSDTSSMATIMCREGVDLLRPRIHWAGPEAGTVESEMPLYAGQIALGWRLWGNDCHSGFAWPRALAILWWAVGGLALTLWVCRRLPAPHWPLLALYALSPLAIVFSRNIQPDAMGVALLLGSLLLADHTRTVVRPGRATAAATGAALLFALAVIAGGKAIFWAPLPPLLVALRPGRARIPLLILSGLLVAGLSAAWLWHARVHLGAEGASFGLWGSGAHKWGSVRVWLDIATWRYIVGTLLSHTFTPVGAVLCAAGVWMAARRWELWPFVIGLGFGLAALVAATEGFRLHDYYQLPLVPFASVLAGSAAAVGWRRLRASPNTLSMATALVLVGLLGLSALLGARFVQHSLRLDDRVARVAAEVAPFTTPTDAVVVVDRHPQSVLYAMDRRGWHRSTLPLDDVRLFEALDADYLLLTDSSDTWWDDEMRGFIEGRWELVTFEQGWRLYNVGVAPGR